MESNKRRGISLVRYQRTHCDNCTDDLSKLKQLYLYFFVFATIYIEFGYRMVVTDTIPGIYRTLFLILICAPLFVISLLKFKFKWRAVVLFVYLTCVIFLNVFRDSSTGNYILLFVPIFVGFVTATSVKFNHLVHIFTNIVIFLAAYSLVLLLFRVVAPGVLSALPYLGRVYETTAAVHDGFFGVAVVNSLYIRNYGPAWEPGAFAILLSSALYCKLNFYKKINIVSIAILTVALITTFSTMGYFVMIAIYLVSLKRGFKNRKATIILLIGIVVLAVALILLPDSVKELVFSKLAGLFTGSVEETTQSRLNAIEYPGKAFLSSPFVGVGYERFSYINEVYCNKVATNTLINWFALMGIVFGLPCAYYYLSFAVKCTKYSRRKLISLIILLFGFVLMVSTESLLRISFIYTIIFYGVQKNVLIERVEHVYRKSREDSHD